MDASPPGGLPPELRNYIYELCFEHPCAIDVLYRRSNIGQPQPCLGQSYGSFGRVPLPRHLLALASACKQLHKEARPVFYACNSFDVHMRNPSFLPYDVSDEEAVQDAMLPLRSFVNRIGRPNVSALRNVSANLGGIGDGITRQPRLSRRILALLRELAATAVANPRWQLQARFDLRYDYGRYINAEVDCAKLGEGLKRIVVRLEREARRTDMKRGDIEAVEKLLGVVRQWVASCTAIGEH